MFDPEKAYDKVAAIGVKWVRIQSGWARTEKEKGVYDFRWLDSIVDNLLARGLKPRMCLCCGDGCLRFDHLPVTDRPMALLFGDFCDWSENV